MMISSVILQSILWVKQSVTLEKRVKHSANPSNDPFHMLEWLLRRYSTVSMLVGSSRSKPCSNPMSASSSRGPLLSLYPCTTPFLCLPLAWATWNSTLLAGHTAFEYPNGRLTLLLDSIGATGFHSIGTTGFGLVEQVLNY